MYKSDDYRRDYEQVEKDATERGWGADIATLNKAQLTNLVAEALANERDVAEALYTAQYESLCSKTTLGEKLEIQRIVAGNREPHYAANAEYFRAIYKREDREREEAVKAERERVVSSEPRKFNESQSKEQQ